MESDLPSIPIFLPKQEDNSKFALFESVIGKYFEIIKGILPKISSLYLENDMFQQNIYGLQARMNKFGTQIENLHYEMRTTHLTIESKLNTIVSHYTSISMENANLKKQTQQLFRQVKSIKQWKNSIPSNTRLKRVGSPDKKENSIELDIRKNKSRKIKFQDSKNIKPSRINLSKRTSLNESSDLSQMELECGPEQKSESKMQFTYTNIPYMMNSEKIMKRKGTLKKQTHFSSRNNLNSKSDKIIINNSINDDHDIDKLQDVLGQISNFHLKNQAIKQSYELLMDNYCRVNNQQFARIHQQIKDMNKKILELNQSNVHIQKLKISTDQRFKQMSSLLESKINQKVSNSDFNNLLIDINSRMGAIHEERKKVANREQTRKAIIFLEDKLNQICTDLDVISGPKLHLVQLDIQSSQNGRPSTITRNISRRESANKTVYQQSYLTPKQPMTTKRQTSSNHSRFRSENPRFNQQLTDNRMRSAEKVSQDAKTLRNTKNQAISQKIKFLKEKSINMIGLKDPAKNRVKLRKERLIFEYDA